MKAEMIVRGTNTELLLFDGLDKETALELTKKKEN